MAKFRLVTKKNLQKKEEPGKWYASPVVINRMKTDTVCRVVTRNTTTAPTELESGINLLCGGIPLQLQMGNSVQIGTLGTMRLSFSSMGVDARRRRARGAARRAATRRRGATRTRIRWGEIIPGGMKEEADVRRVVRAAGFLFFLGTDYTDFHGGCAVIFLGTDYTDFTVAAQ